MVKANFTSLGLCSSQMVGRGKKTWEHRLSEQCFMCYNDCRYYSEIIGSRLGWDRQLRFQNVLLTNRLNGLKCWGHYAIIYSYLNSPRPLALMHAHTRMFHHRLLTVNYLSQVCWTKHLLSHEHMRTHIHYPSFGFVWDLSCPSDTLPIC